MKPPRTIVLSRTDSIGDVVLTLPMAGLIKQQIHGVRIIFIGRRYTLPVLHACTHVDEAVALEDLGSDPIGTMRSWNADAIVHAFPHRYVARWAKRAGIRQRIGTSHRWWHWTTCNERVAFSRRRSELHEAQLNVKLLTPLGIHRIPSLEELAALAALSAPAPDASVQALLRTDRRNVILHPGSRGSAVEWGLENFSSLIRRLDPQQFQCIITGTAVEAEGYRRALPIDLPHVTDAGGALTLEQLIALIGASDALVAASTGPLHITAALGKRAIGIYSSRRPIHPGRWAPIGTNAHALVHDPDCRECAEGRECDCIKRISPERVLEFLERQP